MCYIDFVLCSSPHTLIWVFIYYYFITMENWMKLFEEALEVEWQMVNLTKMCNVHWKRIDVRLKSEQTQAYLAELEAITPNGGIDKKKGWSWEQWTFWTREVAIKLAWWISPKFEVFCMKKLKELFENWTTSIKAKTRLELARENLALIEEIEILEQKALENKPKIEFAEQILWTENGIPFWDAAKAMKLWYGRNQLFAICRKAGLINSDNIPHQKFVDNWYFTVVDTSYLSPKTGDRILTTKTLITAKGQERLIKKLKKLWN